MKSESSKATYPTFHKLTNRTDTVRADSKNSWGYFIGWSFGRMSLRIVWDPQLCGVRLFHFPDFQLIGVDSYCAWSWRLPIWHFVYWLRFWNRRHLFVDVTSRLQILVREIHIIKHFFPLVLTAMTISDEKCCLKHSSITEQTGKTCSRHIYSWL